MIDCKICGKTLQNMSWLSRHIKVHNIQYKEYFDKYIEPFEHTCPICGKERKWQGAEYAKTCGSKECILELTKSKIDYKALCEKTQETYFKRTGYRTPAQNPKVQEKKKTYNLNKYGTEYYFQTKEYKEKAKNTKKIKYGDEFYSNRTRAIKTRREHYPTTHVQKKKKWEVQLVKRNDIVDRWNERYSKKFNKLRLSLNVFRCLECNEIFVDYVVNNHKNYCPNCRPLWNGTSLFEADLCNHLIKIYDGEVKKNDRTILDGYELDIYLPAAKLAIECDGLYWHKENEKRDLWKTEECEKQGIQLLHIWDTEWYEHKDIIMDKINSVLGNNKRIFARKCVIKKLENDEFNEFCDTYHIQGSIVTKYRYGLLYGDELMAVAGFGKSRFEKDKFELIRYCSKAGISVIGGMKKLVTFFKKENCVNEVISYADRRYTTKLHSVYGNEIIKITPQNYHYFHGNTLYNRINFQKHKLKENPLTKDFYDDNLTEKEICELAGLHRIYDCGQLKFLL